jgi:hypothetical protein
LRLPGFSDNRHMKVRKLSALWTGRLWPSGKIPCTHCFQRLSRNRSHSAAGRIRFIKSLKNSFGNRTRYLPACGAVLQSIVLPPPPTTTTRHRAFTSFKKYEKIKTRFIIHSFVHTVWLPQGFCTGFELDAMRVEVRSLRKHICVFPTVSGVALSYSQLLL